ncbi:MAG: SH3 domain-containing protein [Planctomycetota bacterium]|jgi:hypothetical protein
MRLTGVVWCLVLSTVAIAQDLKPFAGEVTASRLKLRAGPGPSYQPVVSIEKGSRVIVLGKHANNPSWYYVEVPQGYAAWVFGRYISKGKNDMGQVTTTRLLLRPRPSTRYHQLSGRLNLNEQVKVLEQKSMPDGLWYRVQVPRRIPLYAHADFIKNIGPASLAQSQPETPKVKASPVLTDSDRQFKRLEPDVRTKLKGAKNSSEVEPLKRAVVEIDRSQLSLENRERRVQLLADLLDTERKFAIRELQAQEDQVKDGLSKRLEEIERKYKRRLDQIRKDFEQESKPRYIATGIVEWVPDIFGRVPSYRLAEAGKMKFFLIATQFDLGRFVGKRVGVSGITDPESGTGYRTVMIRRIEILGEE